MSQVNCKRSRQHSKQSLEAENKKTEEQINKSGVGAGGVDLGLTLPLGGFLEKCGVIFKNGCFFGVRMSNTRCENSAQVFCDMVLSIVCGEGKMKYTENGWKKC